MKPQTQRLLSALKIILLTIGIVSLAFVSDNQRNVFKIVIPIAIVIACFLGAMYIDDRQDEEYRIPINKNKKP